MALPSDLNLITVTGTYINAAGTALQGQVVFFLGSPVADSTGKVILGAGPIPCPLVNGSFSVVLPCTDNPDLAPANFQYTVMEQVPGLGRQYAVSLPHSLGPTVDLSALAP